jgi:hypothetical protein
VVLGRDQTPHALARFDEGLALEKTPCWADRLEIPPPPHGAWLNRAEIEGSLLARDLPERLGDRAALEQPVSVCKQRRNRVGVKADGPFTSTEARLKLCKLYPAVEP